VSVIAHRTWARAIVLLACFASLHCGAATSPDGPEYPALVLPARLPEPDPSAGAEHPRKDATSTPRAAGAAPASQAPPATDAPAQAAPEGGAASEEAPSASSNVGAAAPAGTDAAASPGLDSSQRSHGDLPDPQPLSERVQWSYPITYDRGTVTAGVPELVCLPRPQATARRFGRFAFELWLGRELVDRVRFDFPLLATEAPAPASPRPIHDTPRFAPGARVSVVLRVPASERATRASILDRATGEVLDVTWPPRAPSGALLARDCPAPPARR